MNGLVGKSVIVTGGSSGIGRATVQLLVEAGCHVTIADLDSTAGTQIATDLSAAGPGSAQFVWTDVSVESSVQSLVHAAVSKYGKLDGAVNAAGVAQCGVPLHEVTVDDWDRCHAINLRGLFICVKHQVMAMLSSGGAIVAIASTVATTGLPNAAEYCASKAGVTGFVRGVALDYADKGIRINTISPGATWTPMAQAALARIASLANITDTFPMKRFGEAREVAAGAVWLLSDNASFTTGVNLPIDGAISLG